MGKNKCFISNCLNFKIFVYYKKKTDSLIFRIAMCTINTYSDLSFDSTMASPKFVANRTIFYNWKFKIQISFDL